MKKLSRRKSYNGQNFRDLSRFFCFFFWFLGSIIYAQQNPLDEVMALDLPKIKAVRENLEAHQVQLLLIKIEEKNQSRTFKSYGFQQEDSTYFYPASTVKLPIAVLALQKIKYLQARGIPITKDSPLHVIDPETGKYVQKTDSTESQNQLTIAHLIKKIFLVSDNDAYNYLFDFLGKKAINQEIKQRGIKHTAIRHKFLFGADNENSWEYVFFDNQDTIYHQKSRYSSPLPALRLKEQLKGEAFLSHGHKVETPMDFSQKNWMALSAQLELLKRIIFPEEFTAEEQFDLSQDDLDFLRYWMSRSTLESEITAYTPPEYYDSYGKFFLYGDTKGAMTDQVRIYNKVGYAYGTLTDIAYIEDKANKTAFFLAGTILVNENQIFNDDTYEFDEKGIPFLAEVGRQLYLSIKNNRH